MSHFAAAVKRDRVESAGFRVRCCVKKPTSGPLGLAVREYNTREDIRPDIPGNTVRAALEDDTLSTETERKISCRILQSYTLNISMRC